MALAIALIVFAGPIGIQFAASPISSAGVVEDTMAVNAIEGGSTDLQITGKYGNDGIDATVRWFGDNPAGKALAFPNPLANELQIMSAGRIQTLQLPVVHSKYADWTLQTDHQYADTSNTADEHLPRIGAQHGSRMSQKNRLRVLTQTDVLEMIEEAGVSYIVTNRPGSFLAAYFDAQPQFERAHGTESLRIYRPTSDDLEPIAFTPRIGGSTDEYLEHVEQADRQAYHWYHEDVLSGYYGLNESQIAAIESGDPSPCFVEVG